MVKVSPVSGERRDANSTIQLTHFSIHEKCFYIKSVKTGIEMNRNYSRKKLSVKDHAVEPNKKRNG